ncbi:MAG: iron-containing alcohol dehydrogenase [Blautia obeum]
MFSYQPEAVIAVGGGSAIDSSKAIREFALKINHYSDVGLIAVPTTSGTGSEVTSFAVVNDTRSQGKISTYFTKSDSRRGNSRCRISKERTSGYHS